MPKAIPCTREQIANGGPGLFLLGRAEDCLPAMIKEYAGKVQLIYLDPPFGTGEMFRMRIGGAFIQRPAYADVLPHNHYLAFMRTILESCRELLAPSGSIYLHVDYRMAAPLRMMLDEVFGSKNLMNEIIWAYQSGGRSTAHFSRKHDVILFYRKSRDVFFDIEAVGIPRGPERRNHMKRFVDDKGRVCYSIRSGGKLYTYREDSLVYPSDVWTDIEHLHQRDPERTGYATQKPEALLKRILLASSREGDIVADLFSGSGTTAAVASRTGRRFLVCDNSNYALYALRKRQCEQYNAVSFLNNTQPMELQFPASIPNVQVDASFQREGGYWSCATHKYSAQSDKATLIYCALGSLHDGVFRPGGYAYAPALPLTLRIPACEYGTPALQTMDMEGNQGFWGLDE